MSVRVMQRQIGRIQAVAFISRSLLVWKVKGH
jgi:hypothetical protein